MASEKAGLLAALLALIAALPFHAVAAPGTVPTSTSLAVASGTNALASGATIASGTVVTFVATVDSGATQVTQGQVRLCEASAASCTDIHQFGTAQLTSAGTARFRFVPGIGNHSYKAIFAGTPSASPAYVASSSPAVDLTITGRHATKTAATITQAGAAGHYTMTATVSGIDDRPGLAAPTGTVSFLDTTAANAVLGTSALGSVTTSVTFSQASKPPLTVVPRSTAAADFNGDGFADLVVGANAINVLLGNGDGSFMPVVTTPMSVPEAGPTAVGDFNGDGIPDLAVWSGSSSYSVTILLGKGDGTFSTAPSLDQITSQAMVTGDFNGDGIADLATAEGYAVSIYFGKGDGTFTAASKNSWPGVNPLYLAAGDFNGDDLTDLAVTDTAIPGSVFLLLSNGNGTFSKTGLSPTTGFHLGGIASGDLNGDGFLDLVLANYDGDTNHGLTVLLGRGDGTFQAPVSYGALNMNLRSVAVVDVNGDGIPDLATADENGYHLAVLPGKGDGTFDKEIDLALPASDSGYLIPADFNGDGITDLAIPDSAGNLNLLLIEPAQSVTATVPDVVLTQPGIHQVIASYPGDSLYQSSVSPANSVTFLLNPTVTVTPAATSLALPRDLSVTIVVSGVQGYPTPTGSVSLFTQYDSPGSAELANGSASITVPASALHVGTDTLTVSYTPDAASQAIYTGQYGFATVTVTAPSVAAPPQFSPPTGTYSTTQLVTITNATPGSTINYTVDGSDPTIGSALYNRPIVIASTETVKAITTASGYSPSPISVATYTIGAPGPAPSLINLSPALTSAGGQGFALTVNGSGFSGSSVALWGTTPLATQFVSGNQLVAQVPASDIATAGTTPVAVQTPAPSGVASNVLQFEIDTAAAGSAAAPVFNPAAATIAAGSTATYPVVLPSTATSVSATCLNLPAGATCSYSAASRAITIGTLSTTPAGTSTVTVVFTETEPGAATAVMLLPILLLPFAYPRNKVSSRPLWFTALLGILLLVAGASITACSGSPGSPQPPSASNLSHQVISSATVNLTIQ